MTGAATVSGHVEARRILDLTLVSAVAMVAAAQPAAPGVVHRFDPVVQDVRLDLTVAGLCDTLRRPAGRRISIRSATSRRPGALARTPFFASRRPLAMSYSNQPAESLPGPSRSWTLIPAGKRIESC